MAGLNQTVPDWLRQRAQLTPGRLGLVAADERWSFAELDQRVDRAISVLRERGIQPGQRVGIHAPNGAGFVLALHALARLGAIVVPINTRLAPAEVNWQAEDAELVHILDHAAAEALVHAPAEALIQAPDAPTPSRDFDLDAPHSIIYTSGTSGRPKGAILTFGNHWWNAVGSLLNIGFLPDDQWLACLPLFHVGGLAILLRSVIYGITAVVQERFDPALANRAIDEQRVSIISVVSTMLDRMLAERGGRAYPSTLRCVLLGGGPAPLPLLERAAAAGAPVLQTYGLTETASQVATLAPRDALRKIGSAGKPLMGSEIRIQADGEICVRGPSVSPGYLHRPRREDPWLHTGDLGYVDNEGYLYVLDRRDDLIVSGGENIYPAEVESALLAHPAVEEVGVVGAPDADWGRSVVAVVKLHHDQAATEANLIAFCRQRLAGYKVPRRIVFRTSLPRNAAGKLLRRDLRIER